MICYEMILKKGKVNNLFLLSNENNKCARLELD